ncbi:MAG TPA: lysophospholipid acyltransferase family protein [Bacteroidales bacterium]|nr:lysophospholipid acyltransferase family protein [Bacteroidales bacterium]
MIKARHHIVVYPLFKWLTRFLIKRNFRAVHVEGYFTDNHKAILTIANHVSWWDGFWAEYLNQKIAQRRFYFMMLEQQLKKHWYFSYTGGYSIKTKSREVVKSIDYTAELLHNQENIVLMFPQGKIHSAYNNDIHFEKGVQHIVNKSPDDMQVLFVANFTDYFSDAKPHLYIYHEAYPALFLKKNDIEKEYNQFYTRVLNKHKIKAS